MKNEKLMRAIGEIDEDLIAEAHETQRPRVRWARWSALAAGLVLLVVASPLLGMILVGGFANGGAMAEMDAVMEDIYMGGQAPAENVDKIYSATDKSNGAGYIVGDLAGGIDNSEAETPSKEDSAEMIGICHVGKTLRTDGMALTNMGVEGAVYQMNVKKSDDRPLVLKAMVIRVDGSTVQTFSSDGEGKKYFAFTVNGEKEETLPCTAGAYDITADLSALFALYGEENAILVLVDGVGFLVGGES